MTDQEKDTILLALAKAREPRCTKIHGNAGSSGTVRRYTCNVCGITVDSDSAKWRPTLHAELAIEAHVGAHRANLGPADMATVRDYAAGLLAKRGQDPATIAWTAQLLGIVGAQ